MKEFIEKLIERLEELKSEAYDKWDGGASHRAYSNAIQIVNQLAEEYNNEAVKGDLISKKAVITELNGIYLDNPWDDKEDILEKAIGIVDHFPTAYNNGWIPCSEKMPLFIDNVLVCTKSGGRTVACLTTGKRFCDTYMNIIDNVVAWMPLPPAYVTEERGK